MNYTKGEWKINEIDKRLVQVKIIPNLRFGIADCGNTGLPANEELANANLIMAAPDMYEALKAQHEAIDQLFAILIEQDNTFFPSKSGKPWEAMRQGHNAMVKARGTY